MNKIPKIIHYCWFGKAKKPYLVRRCLHSWKKHLPDYQIIEWNEENFDINYYTFAKQAYLHKKYAFVSDVVRLHVLENYGGIYMDTDIEITKHLDKFLKNSAFSGFENNSFIQTALIGAVPKHPWISNLLETYRNREFITPSGGLDLTPNTRIFTEVSINEYGLITGNQEQVMKDYIHIYPSDYFCPKSWETKKIKITANTHAIHHFDGSWLPRDNYFIRLKSKTQKWTYQILGEEKYSQFKKIIKPRE